MPKTLYLMRHAKSSWKAPLPDRERPLNKRGKKAATQMGRYLRARGIRPDLILSSDARRARATARRVAKVLGLSPESIRIEPRLYDAGASQILTVLEALEERYAQVLLVAHNPGISQAAELLSGNPRYAWLVTAQIVGIELPIERWKTLQKKSEKKGRVIFEAAPKSLPPEFRD